MSNSFGNIYRLTDFGESHGAAMGGVIDGMPAGIAIDTDALQEALMRRNPSTVSGSTSRREPDTVELLSGVYNGYSTGTPIGFVIRNTDIRSNDYSNISSIYRPSHADFTYASRYGEQFRDNRGGGRASARETVCRVVAGELAAQALRPLGINVSAFVTAIGENAMPSTPPDANTRLDSEAIYSSPVRCPDKDMERKFLETVEYCRSTGNSVGGIVECRANGVPAGWGNPVMDKLSARLAYAMMGINAAKGFEIGMGFNGAALYGSEANDIFTAPGVTVTNHSGGIQGGISNGMEIITRTAFKPLPTIMRQTESIDTSGNRVVYTPVGRHDVCVAPRAVAVVEAMTWMVLLDAALSAKTVRLP